MTEVLPILTPVSIDTTIIYTQKLIAIALILQSIELLLIRNTFSDEGIWRWQTLSREFDVFSKITRTFLYFFLPYKRFIFLLFSQIVLAIFVLLESTLPISPFLFTLAILISLRWRGSFNGGSDYVTLMVLLVLSVICIFPKSESVKLGGILYIAIQITSSYFIAGLIKIRQGNWRNGNALGAFINSTIYNHDSFIRSLSRSPAILTLLSWVIIVFEISFITSLFDPDICRIYIIIAFGFHIANAYIFGLNRFIFAWAACYPALIYSCNFISKINL
ncbi:MAG TPA: HTTM domain-containing protein [Oligoflexia bacterium]|nr:HTTM domain-containing protein [Oligoflexia bacterium]HMP48270.1 HTTM domain-containing protein [Oligoflexia bacterium]